MHKPGVYGSLDIRFPRLDLVEVSTNFSYPNSFNIQSVKVSYNDFD